MQFALKEGPFCLRQWFFISTCSLEGGLHTHNSNLMRSPCVHETSLALKKPHPHVNQCSSFLRRVPLDTAAPSFQLRRASKLQPFRMSLPSDSFSGPVSPLKSARPFSSHGHLGREATADHSPKVCLSRPSRSVATLGPFRFGRFLSRVAFCDQNPRPEQGVLYLGPARTPDSRDPPEEGWGPSKRAQVFAPKPFP